MPNTTMTLDDLHRILADCGGASEDWPAGEDVRDRPFQELGYDSLALLEAAVRIENEFGVQVPDEVVPLLTSPRDVLDLVNGSAAKTV
ncbi:acyl carrier protein [Streptomyces albireticuli]|uniref:Actinorhodin polyketide synthase n=1 Tax=Streptomyces albireticuli TaxID=1940 RepID=A0A2A2DFQ7_9ACTN|nr:acyl carrier protein [Streptomyces albireticuli]MCD9141286.1 acyl carrier protein [Streptomyces albireticuli]MCD9160753.1 acyl carrier protein [Streptomyces albireticuli]MCD9191190.1 acyl carrier protein [Streptomyces albireticuli]PAU50365.1 actinorhodin polyketide synthase [Streptomyces albireticuli]